MTVTGFTETISLNGRIEAVVSVHRGGPVQLRLPDFGNVFPLVAGREWIASFVDSARRQAGREQVYLFFACADGFTQAAPLAPDRVEPLIALMLRAVKFSEEG